MSEKIYIPIKFPGMNEMIAAAKRNPHVYSAMKKEFTEAAAWHFKIANLRKCEEIFLELTWYEKTERRDPDNVVAAKKFLFDGLIMAEVIPNDTKKFIIGWKEVVVYKDGNKQGVEVVLI